MSEALIEAVRAGFAQHRDVVLQAPTGSGKSTLVPPALLAEPWLKGRKILMLEPRRVAARAVSARMAQHFGDAVGGTVGYRMRLDSRVSARTRIEVITEGVLARLLQSDPSLDGVGLVIFDEFHERSLQADLGLALALDARAALEAPFRILLMSATVNGARIAALLGDAALCNVGARAYPVEVRYVGQGLPPLPEAGYTQTAPDVLRRVAAQIQQAVRELDGDVLVFLPGAGEIRRVQQFLAGTELPARCRVLPLYGELSAAAQDEAIAPARPGERKVVLATNVAETSVTIPGVTAVIDTGLARRSLFDPATGMSRLAMTRISRASAEQRAGRAGRTAPGLCLRLWGEGAHASLHAETPPEIIESDLAPLALELAAWGARDPYALCWLDPPPNAQWNQAVELLQTLAAFDDAQRISSMGRAMATLPVHPRLAHMLCAASERDRARAAELAALLSERDLMRGGDRDPDFARRLELLRGETRVPEPLRPALLRARQQAKQVLERLKRGDVPGAARAEELSTAEAGKEEANDAALLALAYPDRIAQSRGAGGRYLLSNGRGAAFRAVSSLARSDYLVAIELDDADREARIDLAIAIGRTELDRVFADRIHTVESVSWDPHSEAVLAVRRRMLGSLVLEERPLQELPAGVADEAMLQGVRSLGLAALPWDSGASALRARMEFIRRLKRPEAADWPASDDDTLFGALDQWLLAWLAGCTRRAHLARLPLASALRARLNSTEQRLLEEWAPREFIAPTGSHLTIDYEDDNAPCVEVRLQEVFGVASTPRLGGGTVPLTFKLLSPARRPVQITRDLAGFWQSSYKEVRKEMRGRYPKHYWPEDPRQAEPRRGVRR